MLRPELGNIIVTLDVSKYSPMTHAGKMAITWENKVGWRAFEVMLTVSGCVGFNLQKKKNKTHSQRSKQFL